MPSTNTPQRKPATPKPPTPKPVNGTPVPAPPPPAEPRKVIAVQHREPEAIGRAAFLATVEILGYEPLINGNDPEYKLAYAKHAANMKALRELSRE